LGPSTPTSNSLPLQALRTIPNTFKAHFMRNRNVSEQYPFALNVIALYSLTALKKVPFTLSCWSPIYFSMFS
jgi:hypothetical protein